MASTAIKTEPKCSQSLQKMCRLCLSEEALDDVFKEESLHQWILAYLSITLSTEDRLSQSICTICRVRLIDFHQFRTRCLEVQEVLQSMLLDDHHVVIEKDTFAQRDIYESKNHGRTSCGGSLEIRQHLVNHLDDHGKPELCDRDDFTTETREQKVGLISFEQNSNLKNSELLDIPQRMDVDSVDSPHDAAQDHDEQIYSRIDRGETDDDASNDIEDMIDIEEVKIETRSGDDVEGNVTRENTKNSSTNNDQSVQTKSGKKPFPFQCNICQKVYKTQEQISQHHRLHKPRKYECKICDMKFQFRQVLQKHERTKKHLTKVQEISTNSRSPVNDMSHVTKDNQTDKDGPKSDANSFKCDLCDQIFHNDYELLKHNRYVHVEVNFKCHICKIGFDAQFQLKAHTKSKTHLNRLKYNSVNKQSDNEKSHDTVRDHGEDDTDSKSKDDDLSDTEEDESTKIRSEDESDEDDDQQFQCNICQKEFSSKQNLRSHRKIHKPKKHACPICEKPFLRRTAVKEHIPIHYSKHDRQQAKTRKKRNNGEQLFKCDLCEKEYKLKNSLITHKRQAHAPRNHICHICGHKSFARVYLVRHLQSHYRGREENFQPLYQMQQEEAPTMLNESQDVTNNKEESSVSSTPCSKCHKVFPSHYLMWRHFKQHSQIHKCSFCDESFKIRKLLGKHMSTVHKQEHESLKCDTCNKFYSSSDKLKRHQRFHAPKKHSCTICNKTFREKKTLVKHMEKHKQIMNLKDRGPKRNSPSCTVPGDDSDEESELTDQETTSEDDDSDQSTGEVKSHTVTRKQPRRRTHGTASYEETLNDASE